MESESKLIELEETVLKKFNIKNYTDLKKVLYFADSCATKEFFKNEIEITNYIREKNYALATKNTDLKNKCTYALSVLLQKQEMLIKSILENKEQMFNVDFCDLDILFIADNLLDKLEEVYNIKVDLLDTFKVAKHKKELARYIKYNKDNAYVNIDFNNVEIYLNERVKWLEASKINSRIDKINLIEELTEIKIDNKLDFLDNVVEYQICKMYGYILCDWYNLEQEESIINLYSKANTDRNIIEFITDCFAKRVLDYKHRDSITNRMLIEINRICVE